MTTQIQKKPAGKKRATQKSSSDRPIMVLIDLLGRRWTLRIIWELRDGEMSSRTLRAACDNASPTVLHARLSELRDAGLVELIPASGYSLTRHGKELFDSLMPLAKFASRWSEPVAET